MIGQGESGEPSTYDLFADSQKTFDFDLQNNMGLKLAENVVLESSGQAKRFGIQAGWKIILIKGEPFRNDVLANAVRQGYGTLSLTFEEPVNELDLRSSSNKLEPAADRSPDASN